jgi:hypothetical protein
VFDAGLTELSTPGYALIVALVTVDGEPSATRAWSLEPVSADPPVVRVALPAGELVRVGHDPAALDVPIAVTGGDVATLQSKQIKGRAIAVEPPNDHDRGLIELHVEGFFGAVESVDGIPRELLRYLVADDFDMVTVEVAEMYDQTPGPTAGSLVAAVGGSEP